MARFVDADKALRAAVLTRFAVYGGSRPARCSACSDRKIMFEDRRAAEGAVLELSRLVSSFDGRPAFVYPCPRSEFWHITRLEQFEDATEDEGTGV